MKRTTIINALICAVVSMSIISCENSKVYDVRLSGEGVDLFPVRYRFSISFQTGS